MVVGVRASPAATRNTCAGFGGTPPGSSIALAGSGATAGSSHAAPTSARITTIPVAITTISA